MPSERSIYPHSFYLVPQNAVRNQSFKCSEGQTTRYGSRCFKECSEGPERPRETAVRHTVSAAPRGPGGQQRFSGFTQSSPALCLCSPPLRYHSRSGVLLTHPLPVLCVSLSSVTLFSKCINFMALVLMLSPSLPLSLSFSLSLYLSLSLSLPPSPSPSPSLSLSLVPAGGGNRAAGGRVDTGRAVRVAD